MRATPRLLRAVLASCLILGAALAVVAYALSAHSGGPGSRPGAPSVRLDSSDGPIAIQDSLAGRAVFSARDMVPGQTASGEVTISNPNSRPIAVSLSARSPAPGPLGQELALSVAQKGGSRLYGGSLAGLPQLPLGTLAAGESRTYSFDSTLPASAGDGLQGQGTSIDLLWTAGAGRAPICGLAMMRPRLLVFRGRDALRLTARYRLSAKAKLTVGFYRRGRGGRPGAQVAGMTARFGKSSAEWKIRHLTVGRPAAEMAGLRHSRRGFVARIRVAGGAPYCSRRLTANLSERRIVNHQQVWFPRGAFAPH